MCVSTRNKQHLRPLGELQGARTLVCQARTGSNDLVLRTLGSRRVRGALAGEATAPAGRSVAVGQPRRNNKD